MSDPSLSGADPQPLVPHYRGLTWDHPRGRHALEAAAAIAARDGTVAIEWDAHPLEGFESAPIAELAERYDLIVLDHPHLGEALASGSFVPLEQVFDAGVLGRIAADAIGPSFTSYALNGSQWALPLDAATQVAALRIDLIADATHLSAAQMVDAHSAWGAPAHGPIGADPVPLTWVDVLALSERAPVALSLAGPHAFLTFASVLAGAGAPLADDPGGDAGRSGNPLFSSRAVARELLGMLRTIARRSPVETHTENPIALLERMTTTTSLAYVPLVYGYVNYSSPTLQFRDAPRWGASARLGSTIGGTGIAISKRCPITTGLVSHLTWLLATETQRTFIPEHDGQPGLRSAWHDVAVNEAAHNFYVNTAETIEQSWVRPRYDGYIAFQTEASALLRGALLGEAAEAAEAADDADAALIEACLDALEAAFAASMRVDALATRIHSEPPTTSGVRA